MLAVFLGTGVEVVAQVPSPSKPFGQLGGFVADGLDALLGGEGDRIGWCMDRVVFLADDGSLGDGQRVGFAFLESGERDDDVHGCLRTRLGRAFHVVERDVGRRADGNHVVVGHGHFLQFGGNIFCS